VTDKRTLPSSRALALLLYLAVVLIIGALIAPLLYWCLPYIARGPLEFLADTPFRRVADRAFMLCALIALYPLVRYLSLTRDDWGWRLGPRRFAANVGVGIAIGVLSLLILVGIEIGIGVVVWDDRRDVADLIRAIASGILGGIVIGVIEESCFRGAMYGGLRRRRSIATAALVTAVIYASVHFIRSSGEFKNVYWYSGFELIGSAFTKYATITTIGPFLALVAVGVFLALVRERTGHIALGVGIHCGWVAVIKLGRKATNLDNETGLAWLAEGYDGITGYLAFAYIIGLIIVLLAINARARGDSDAVVVRGEA
jgi:membrane protease YdiL (CAAX protease family)